MFVKCSMQIQKLFAARRWIVLQTFVVILGAMGCSKSAYEGATEYQIPWPTSGGDYRLTRVRIDSLTEPEALRGSKVEILVNPGRGAKGLESTTPVGRYAKLKGGVMVPADFVTMQSVVVIAHQERLLDLDQKVGVADLLSLPLKVGVSVDLNVPNSDLKKNNALYVGQYDALLIVPYTNTGLPISINAGVLAHEHFHAVFQRLLINPLLKELAKQNTTSALYFSQEVAEHFDGDDRIRLPRTMFDVENVKLKIKKKTAKAKNDSKEPPPPLVDKSVHSEIKPVPDDRGPMVSEATFNEFIVAGMNEGFADFWGWIYSVDDDFVGRSLSFASERRRLDGEIFGIPEINILKLSVASVDRPEERRALSYDLGTRYARFFRRIVKNMESAGVESEQARLIVAKALIDSLKDVSGNMVSQYATEFISPNSIFSPMFQRIKLAEQRGLLQSCRDLALIFPLGTYDLKAPISPCEGVR